MVPRKQLGVVLFLTIFTAIVFVARYGLRDGTRLSAVDGWIHSGNGMPKPAPCQQHLGWLEPYQFTYPIQYVSRDILTTPNANGERPSLTVVDEPLFDEFTAVDLAQSQIVDIKKCLPPLTLEVPHGPLGPADASHMIFGLQITMRRLKATVKHLARWLPNTNAKLIAMVVESDELAADDADMAALEKQFQDLGMNVKIVHPVRQVDSFAQRYFSLVSVMYQARSEGTEWVVCIDDDTFFPSMHDLVNLLNEYDSSREHYIGSLSEDWWAVNHYGLMGFGGAGIMLSTPMAKVIEDTGLECKDHLRTTSGDVSVMDCIYGHSSTKLTSIPSLHQVDMSGDLSGFYESGREMLSLHHWKEGSAAGYKLEMEKMHLVADICDNCFLQRWQFPKETVLSNGFSIATYPGGHLTGKDPKGGVLHTGVGGKPVDKINLDFMEETWRDGINVAHSLEPKRPKMADEFKIGYKLLDSVKVDADANGQGGFVRQVYFKEGWEGVRDTVMVLNWHPGDSVPVRKMPMDEAKTVHSEPPLPKAPSPPTPSSAAEPASPPPSPPKAPVPEPPAAEKPPPPKPAAPEQPTSEKPPPPKAPAPEQPTSEKHPPKVPDQPTSEKPPINDNPT